MFALLLGLTAHSQTNDPSSGKPPGARPNADDTQPPAKKGKKATTDDPPPDQKTGDAKTDDTSSGAQKKGGSGKTDDAPPDSKTDDAKTDDPPSLPNSDSGPTDVTPPTVTPPATLDSSKIKWTGPRNNRMTLQLLLPPPEWSP